jgi:two-component system sensor histidine kinase KdpD
MSQVGRSFSPAHHSPQKLSRSLLWAVPGFVVAGLVTFICYGLGANFAIAGFCYLIVVVLQSLAGDFRSSALVSFLCAACLDYFFIPPLFSFRISDISDSLAAITFLVTGLVITRLVSQTREAAESEQLQRLEITRLYQLARQLLALEAGTALGVDLLKPFRSQFELRAVCLFDGGTAQLYVDGASQDGLAEKTRTAYIERKNLEEPASGVAVGLLQAGGNTTGAIGFEGLRDCHLTAGPLTALATVMVEHCLAFDRASHAAATAEAEIFRGAMLDALAHEFKTPLTTILTAAGGLHAAGALKTEQKQLVDAVESEASRLEQLTTRLLRLARLDREELRPQMELINIEHIVENLVEAYSRRWPDRRFSLSRASDLTTLGDVELLRLGISQLLDNACKYSRSGSEVKVSLGVSDTAITIDVWNAGSPIASKERGRIFERFYRGTSAHMQVPGSGLGLYVARKIADAHGGTVELGASAGNDLGALFRFTIPLVDSEPDHDISLQSSSD